MADTPNGSRTTPYILAVVILVLIGALLVGAVLFMRPNLDPLLLIVSVFGILGTIFTGIAAFMKSDETHRTVNSQLSAWKEEFSAMKRAEGIIAGTETEQKRVAEQKRVEAAGPTTPTNTLSTTTEPVPVAIVDTEKPVPVIVEKK